MRKRWLTAAPDHDVGQAGFLKLSNSGARQFIIGRLISGAVPRDAISQSSRHRTAYLGRRRQGVPPEMLSLSAHYLDTEPPAVVQALKPNTTLRKTEKNKKTKTKNSADIPFHPCCLNKAVQVAA
jgi:hypothetical protein